MLLFGRATLELFLQSAFLNALPGAQEWIPPRNQVLPAVKLPVLAVSINIIHLARRATLNHLIYFFGNNLGEGENRKVYTLKRKAGIRKNKRKVKSTTKLKLLFFLKFFTFSFNTDFIYLFF